MGCGARGRRRGLAGLVTATQAPPVWRVPEGPGCGARGRRRGLAGLVTATQATPVWRVPTGPEGCGARLRCPWAAAGPGRASRRRTQPHTATQAPPVWRVPEGQAAGPVGGGGAWPGFEATRRAKLAARTARGRAAAHGHTKQPGLARHTKQPGPSTRAHTPSRRNKTARPHWGRAAVAVALGFEPRVAVTPHSISSAAPSAARTRYLTRILYYMDPHRAQIDREVWDQGHTTSQDHTAARNTGTTSACRTVENKIK